MAMLFRDEQDYGQRDAVVASFKVGAGLFLRKEKVSDFRRLEGEVDQGSAPLAGIRSRRRVVDSFKNSLSCCKRPTPPDVYEQHVGLADVVVLGI